MLLYYLQNVTYKNDLKDKNLFSNRNNLVQYQYK